MRPSPRVVAFHCDPAYYPTASRTAATRRSSRQLLGFSSKRMRGNEVVGAHHAIGGLLTAGGDGSGGGFPMSIRLVQ